MFNAPDLSRKPEPMSETVTNELLYETRKQIQRKLSEHDQHFNRLEDDCAR